MATTKVVRLVIVADSEWAEAISRTAQYVEDGEVCIFQEWSEPFDYVVPDGEEE